MVRYYIIQSLRRYIQKMIVITNILMVRISKIKGIGSFQIFISTFINVKCFCGESSQNVFLFQTFGN